ncbi:MAG: hypothetical protein Ct9H90mP16_21840 [Candidatus Poseidoniales archaeon]|nr:MAG: hypothetical protein Ct9H90mP16_21840 [Candidatus Poseidoniales archaeon]
MPIRVCVNSVWIEWHGRLESGVWIGSKVQHGSRNCVKGLMRTLAKVGLINLDLMDLRAIVQKRGFYFASRKRAIVTNPRNFIDVHVHPHSQLYQSMGQEGACLKVGGGASHDTETGRRCPRRIHSRFVIGCSSHHWREGSPELGDRMRVVAVVSGLPKD